MTLSQLHRLHMTSDSGTSLNDLERMEKEGVMGF